MSAARTKGVADIGDRAREAVINYYRQSYVDYVFVLGLRRHLGIHYGYFEKGHRSVRQAIVNMNQELAWRAGIGRGMQVLDAGCGVGGSAIWLAKQYGATVTGITLVPQHVVLAMRYAAERGVTRNTEFLVRDFCNTGFPARSFDVVWALESACYASDKKAFLAEARRVLRPNGRIIVADGFQVERILNAHDESMMSTWLNGWAVPQLATVGEFQGAMQSLGFVSVSHEEVTENVRPFGRWLYRRARMWLPVARLLAAIGIRTETQTNNVLAAIWQYRAMERGLWKYVIFEGTAPWHPSGVACHDSARVPADEPQSSPGNETEQFAESVRSGAGIRPLQPS